MVERVPLETYQEWARHVTVQPDWLPPESRLARKAWEYRKGEGPDSGLFGDTYSVPADAGRLVAAAPFLWLVTAEDPHPYAYGFAAETGCRITDAAQACGAAGVYGFASGDPLCSYLFAGSTAEGSTSEHLKMQLLEVLQVVNTSLDEASIGPLHLPFDPASARTHLG